MDLKSATGAVITILGLILFLYIIVDGVQKGAIGSKDEVSTDALLTILAWFMILGGPALWFGETPAIIKRKAGR